VDKEKKENLRAREKILRVKRYKKKEAMIH
jgi:hypothetical protein